LTLLSFVVTAPLGAADPGNGLDDVLQRENSELGIELDPAPIAGDLVYLRRVTVDLIGRIPTEDEIQEFLALPKTTRRAQVVENLLASDRFSDRWTTFFADMLRLRSNAEGGSTLIAFVHKAVEEGMPYDELCRRLISAGGKSGAVPEVGFILSDNADPLALAGITSQVFLGVRMACAECHDHPFDKWTREDFYGLAAYFGKTRRVQRRFQNRILATYTTEVDQSTVLWPPPGVGEDADRKPIAPTFPIALINDDGKQAYLQRFAKVRASRNTLLAQAAKSKKTSGEPSLDELLSSADKRVERRTSGDVKSGLGVLDEAKRDVEKIDVRAAGYRPSDLRRELARQVTSPRNRFFSRAFVNRVWKELVGVGFVEPIDDFSSENDFNHPQTLNYLADEFVAQGFDLRGLIGQIVSSEAYQREHAVGVDAATRLEMENAFIATPMRRMISETLYDSIVVAGHMAEVKHEAGKNMKIAWRATRVMKRPDATTPQLEPTELVKAGETGKKMKKPVVIASSPYDLEKAIELDFDKLLKGSDPAVEVEKMMAKSTEEIEAERMLAQEQRLQADYYDRYIRAEFDDNPSFNSSFRMASPAAPEHFLRVFGQPGRTELGDFRDPSASMRQQLMILNGRLTHEASRVGELEPLHRLLVGKNADLTAAIQLAYRELLTRNPSREDLADATEMINAAEDRLAGMADLRWVLLNSNEFRFLP
jgi:hypothetical protein